MLKFKELLADDNRYLQKDGNDDETLQIDALVKRLIQRVLRKTGGKIHGPGGAGELFRRNSQYPSL